MQERKKMHRDLFEFCTKFDPWVCAVEQTHGSNFAQNSNTGGFARSNTVLHSCSLETRSSRLLWTISMSPEWQRYCVWISLFHLSVVWCSNGRLCSSVMAVCECIYKHHRHTPACPCYISLWAYNKMSLLAELTNCCDALLCLNSWSVQYHRSNMPWMCSTPDCISWKCKPGYSAM